MHNILKIKLAKRYINLKKNVITNIINTPGVDNLLKAEDK